MYLSYWYAGLYVVCEGWQELKLSDAQIDALLQSPHLEFLKRFRNGVYHYQADYFDKRFMDALVRGEDFDRWAESLTAAFGRCLDASPERFLRLRPWELSAPDSLQHHPISNHRLDNGGGVAVLDCEGMAARTQVAMCPLTAWPRGKPGTFFRFAALSASR
jgi:hypothetical protein